MLRSKSPCDTGLASFPVSGVKKKRGENVVDAEPVINANNTKRDMSWRYRRMERFDSAARLFLTHFSRVSMDTPYYPRHTPRMRISLTLPDDLAERFFALVPSRQRSTTVARLLAQELRHREAELEAACQAANADTTLTADIAEWQAFEDDLEESSPS